MLVFFSPPVDVAPFVMFAADSAIMKVDLDGNNLETLVPDQSAFKGKVVLLPLAYLNL